MQPTIADILASLSLALDLVEGQPEGHAIRTGRVALELGKALRLPSEVMTEIYFASLLKDSGCSNNSVRIHHIFGGDEVASKQAVKLIDWTNPIDSLCFAFAQTEKGNGVGAKLRRLVANISPPKEIMREVTAARCNRGADIARKLNMGDAVARAIQCLDEHWDGKGAPEGLKGDQITIHALVIGAAQTAEIFNMAFGPSETLKMVRARKGKWFSPEVSDALIGLLKDENFWHQLIEITDHREMEIENAQTQAVEADIDSICEAFGMIVDAKSSFTWQHSARVTKYAGLIAVELGVPLAEIQVIRRAAMVHDIGKLGISTSILEKPDRLTDSEMNQIRQHSRYSYEILSKVPTFDAISVIASDHHERLDGKGYWRGICGDQINLGTRIVTVADVFDALTAERPYKEPMPLERVFKIMDGDAGTAFDPACMEALHAAFDAGLTQKAA